MAMNWNDAFGQRGLAAETAAPVSVEEQDLPPGAPPYAGGPLAGGPPQPSPTPNPNISLTTLAAGGMNHAQLWMSGQTSAPLQQQPFKRSAATIQDTLAQNGRVPERAPKSEDLGHFAWGSGFR